MMHLVIFNTAHICWQMGVRHAVMSPGSRNAPLTVSFARHEQIQKWIVPDERAAGFIALGIAQATKTPVVLCCTSGSALLNYAPAIAEAYYREIPLIVLSADRPPELIDQRDGQTIRQFEALKNHVKDSIRLPLVLNEQDSARYQEGLINGIGAAMELPTGPSHINIPFKEPFYPTPDQKLSYQDIALAPLQEKEPKVAVTLPETSSYKRVLILVGQHNFDKQLNNKLSKLADSIPLLRSPLNNLSAGIEHVDSFIADQESLQPDLLITSGLSVLSKKLKQFLRRRKPQLHLHFDEGGVPVDTYSSNPILIKRELSDALDHLDLTNADIGYLSEWKQRETSSKKVFEDEIETLAFSETVAAFAVLDSLPNDCILHLSNSMPVRYADLFGTKAGVEVFANRGTSGIDGCTSTAVGTSLVSDKQNVLITGELAFLYDRNAFFHNYPLPNLRIIVLNNQGGGIFRLIDGPAGLPELESYFETRHNKTAEFICKEVGLKYQIATDRETLTKSLADFFGPSENGKVLEVFTDPQTNQLTYKQLKNILHERIND